MTSKLLKSLSRKAGAWMGPRTKLLSFADYETYRRVQQEGNERKLHLVYARERDIAHLARYAQQRIGNVRAVLCHGTRNGAEIKWFKANLSGSATVLGTDISSTASRFPDTIQWDFHEMKPEWAGRWNVVYSNSWDHAYDPKRAYQNWMLSLAPRGLLFLEHSKNHEPWAVNQLDPFGATLNGLIRFIKGIGGDRYQVVDVLADLPDAANHRVVVIANRTT